MSHEETKLHSWNVTIRELFAQWQLEHRDLQLSIDKLRRWIFEASQSSRPLHRETADQLRALKDRLLEHFAREDVLGRQLLESDPTAELELSAMCRQADHDHSLILNRLEALVRKLESSPAIDDWSIAANEVELFVDSLEEHEELESDSVKCWLHGR